MPVFHYRAKQKDGKDVSGQSEAPDLSSLVGQLRQQGLVVLDVQEEGKGGKPKKSKQPKQKKQGGGDAAIAAMHAKMGEGGEKKDSGKKRRKVTTRDLAILCRQLSTMLKAGLPIIDALETLAAETENLSLAEVLWQIRNDVEGGSSLSEAINRHPKTFNLMFRAMIEAGEASGSLVKIIQQLGEYLKKQDAMAKKVKSATMYPKFVAGFFGLIIAGVLLFLVPQFEDTFRALSTPCAACYEEGVAFRTPYDDDPSLEVGTGYVIEPQRRRFQAVPLDAQGNPTDRNAKVCPRCNGYGESAPLPMMTQVLLAASRFVFANFLFVLAGLVLLFVLWKKWSSSEQGGQILDKVVLKIPVAGALALKAATARWCMTLSTLLSNGVSLDQSLDIVSRVSGNIVIEDATQRVRELIVQGQGLATSMQLFPIFPAMVVKMVSVGEESGALAEMLSDISEYYEEEVAAAVEGISSIIEPLMIVMLGAIVAVVVLAIYLPIFQMGQAAGGMG